MIPKSHRSRERGEGQRASAQIEEFYRAESRRLAIKQEKKKTINDVFININIVAVSCAKQSNKKKYMKNIRRNSLYAPAPIVHAHLYCVVGSIEYY